MDLKKPQCKAQYGIMEVLFRRNEHKNHKRPNKVWKTVNLDFQVLLDSNYSNTHTHTMTEEKGIALEVEQKQEMGTVGNLCAADQANASVNRKGD